MRRDFGFWAYVALVCLAMAGFGILGGTKALGAHPFWSGQVAFIGIAIGLPVAWGISQIINQRALRLGFVTAALIAAVFLTNWGKARFVASFAEDTLGGRFWYFGWMGICAAIVVLALQFVPRNPARS